MGKAGVATFGGWEKDVATPVVRVARMRSHSVARASARESRNGKAAVHWVEAG
jgi:hypothetical protein